MKLKSLVMFAIIGMLATFLTLPLTALADDQNDSNDMAMQQQQPQANPSDNMPNNVAQNNNDSVGAPDNSVSTDQATPDTATGDDDY